MSLYRPTARNFSAASENKIHSDDIAKQFGFEGALVAGVAVFGHMTYPLVEEYGEDWLHDRAASVRLIKPAYDGDVLSIEHSREGDLDLVRCSARDDVLLAELRSTAGLPPIDELAEAPGGAAIGERPVVAWDKIHEGEPFPRWTWLAEADDNKRYVEMIDDRLPIWDSGVVHPHFILSQANRAFSMRFVLPAGIHVGSEVRFREVLKVGDAVEVRTVPVQKFRKKGHEFVELYIAYVVAERVVTEIRHTAIFSVAAAA